MIERREKNVINKTIQESLLTAVILTFNNETTIERCIKSLVEQKTDYPYEIHIYDDCSKDRNLEICKKYAEKYPEKIKLFPQKENTFLMPYKKTQAFKAIQGVNTKYFCIIEGDDYWCDENKVQIALDFLENNPEYIGFAHDTMQVNEFDGSERSWVHDLAKYEIKNPVTLSKDFKFFMTSSRIFRNCGFKNVGIWPVDYLVYNYHLGKGPIYYYDKIMSVYTFGQSGTWATLGKDSKDMNGMFSYKVSCLFDFKHDDICTEMQKWYDRCCGSGLKHYERLLKFKKIFGIKLGWKLWFIHRFVFKYGFESMDLNYVYPRKLIKEISNKKSQKDQLNTILRQKYELYFQDKNNLQNKKELFALFDELINFNIANNHSQEIITLQDDYPEAKQIFFEALSTILDRNKSKIAKYKKQRKNLILLTIFLLNLIIILSAIFCMGILK